MKELYLNILALDSLVGSILSTYERSVLHRLIMEYPIDKSLITKKIIVFKKLIIDSDWKRPCMLYWSKDKEGLMLYNTETGNYDIQLKDYDDPIIEKIQELF